MPLPSGSSRLPVARRSSRRGLSILEIQISLLLLLLITLYLMSLFASGSRHAARALDYSRATTLARRRLEGVRRLPSDDITPGLERSDDPNPGFNTTLTVTPFGPLLTLLQVEAHAPSGAVATCSTLVEDPTLIRGVACDPFTSQVAWTSGTELRIWDDLTASRAATLADPESRKNGPVVGLPGSGFLWRGDRMLPPIAHRSAGWDPPLLSPVALPDNDTAAPRWSGGVSDAFTTQSLWTDAANRCVWWHNGAAWSRLKPANPPLGRLTAVAADPALSLVWVADLDNGCLRKLVNSVSAASSGLDGSGEAAGSFGFWDRRKFRPRPADRLAMGTPLALAMDPQGSGVFVHDGCRLYRFDEARSPQWTEWCALDPALVAEGASGMAADRFGSTLFFNTRADSLWKVKLTGGGPGVFTFTRVDH